jgi:UDP:flavonoid glycosyltransferase YjiC (YdhE family)
MDIKERSDEKMKTIYGASLGTLCPAELAARLILAFISTADQIGEDWYRQAEFISRKNGTGKLAVVSCHTGFLSHTGRPLFVAKALRELEAEVVFMAGAHRNGEDDEQGRYAHLISQEGFRIYDAPSQAGVRRIMNKAQVEGTWHWFDEEMILQEVQTQRRVLQSIIEDCKRKPDVIITDLSQAMSITAELEGIPLVSILNFTWTNHGRIRHTPPEYHITTRICRRMGMARVNEYLASRFGTTTMVLRLLLTLWVKPYNRVRKSLGLKSRRNFFYQMAGDLILMPDLAAIQGMEIEKTALPIGPLTWEPQDEEIRSHVDKTTLERFQTFLDADMDTPLVYLTMGSTGKLALFKVVIAALKDKPYRLAVTTGGQFDTAELGQLPSNVCTIAFFPGNRILEKASVTVNHGGSGSVYQAMAAQVPQIIIPTHGDQQWNADIVQAEGAGIRLRHWGLTAGKIADAVATLLNTRQPDQKG